MSPTLSELGTDFYVPAFVVKIGGTTLEADVVSDVMSVTYKDKLESIDTFSLLINNWDEEKRTFKYSDGDRFKPGQLIQLDLGYLDQGLETVLFGEITTLQPQFPSGGPPTLAVTGLSVLHQLRAKPFTRVFENKTESAIAKDIGSQLGLDIDTNPEAEAEEQALPYVLQHQEQDIVFLLKRARRIGYELTVTGLDQGQPKIYYGPQSGGTPTPFPLVWGGSLISIAPKLSTASQVGSVLVRGWHPWEKRLIEVEVKRDELGDDPPFGETFSGRQEVITDRPVFNDAEARQLATETLRRIAHNYVTATGATVGLPALRAGALIDISGVGDRFSGRYFATSSSHTINDSGYKTSFECRWEVAS